MGQVETLMTALNRVLAELQAEESTESEEECMKTGKTFSRTDT